jgi:hypothetical protein
MLAAEHGMDKCVDFLIERGRTIHPRYTPSTPPIHPLHTPYTPHIHPYTPPIHPLYTPYTTSHDVARHVSNTRRRQPAPLPSPGGPRLQRPHSPASQGLAGIARHVTGCY